MRPSGVVTGRSQTKPRQTYAAGPPSTRGRWASSGTPGASGGPTTTTVPPGATVRAWAVRLVGEHGEQWLAELREAMEKVDELRTRGPEL